MAFSTGSEAYKLDVGVYRQRVGTGSEARMGKRSKVAPKAKVFRQMAEALGISLVALFLGVLYVSQHANMALLSDQLNVEQKMLHDLKADNDHLRLQLIKLQALSRVEDIARSKGQMVEPDEGKAITLQAGDVKPYVTGSRRSSVQTVVLDVQELAQSAHTRAQ